jgi:D-sedoheptulose 7-phosphate isomerase
MGFDDRTDRRATSEAVPSEPVSTAPLPAEDVEPSSTHDEFRAFVDRYVSGLIAALMGVDRDGLERLVRTLEDARRNNRQIFVFGNGGSAANASHFATDFSKRRFPDGASLFRVLSLTDNTAWISATANDFGYDEIFSAQLSNLLQPGDTVIAISSSGNSPNVIKGVEFANAKGAVTYGIVGFGGGKLSEVARHSLVIPTKTGQYGFMEDVTSIITHIASVFIYEQDRRRFGLPEGRNDGVVC